MALPEVVGYPALEDARYLNRELSWLDFNARVLALAEDATLPLLERAKFLAIFSSNLDEFFQVRVSGLQEQLAAGVRSNAPDGLDQVEQLRAIRIRVEELVARQAARLHQGSRARAPGRGRRVRRLDRTRATRRRRS